MASSENSHPAHAIEVLEHLGRLSLRDLSMAELLQTVADLTKTVMPGHTEASVSLLVKDGPSTVASTGQLATDLDESQYDRGYGPCLHAARTGELTEIADARTDGRWPDYMPRAAEHGALSLLAVPLAIDADEQVSGALNIYAREPHAFDEDSRSAATRFAPYAAVAAGNLYAYRSAVDRADNLRIALEARGVIDQAKGILMARHKLTAHQAFLVLARMSMKTDRNLHAIADDLVRTGELAPREPAGTGELTRPGAPAESPQNQGPRD